MKPLPKPEFDFGQIVWYRIGGDKGMVTRMVVNPHGIVYEVSWDDKEATTHYSIELSAEQIFE